MNKFLVIFFSIAIFTKCVDEDNTIPKPTGYFRINFPEHKYELANDSLCPFAFEKPVYTILSSTTGAQSQSCFKNLYYPQFKATVYFTYVSIDSNFNDIIQYAEDKVYEHRVMASGIEPKDFVNYEDKVYGTAYSLMGDVAVNYLFYITDSTKHYFAGQLFFETIPNYDSLQPCIDFITNDMQHLIETFKWK